MEVMTPDETGIGSAFFIGSRHSTQKPEQAYSGAVDFAV